MDNFKYKNNKLFCDGVSVEKIAQKYGTPFYLYSQKHLVDRFRDIDNAFSKVDHLVCFSVKTNSNLTILRTLVKLGAGLDIVSVGELFRALKAGCSPQKIVYAGVGKRPDEIKYAIKSDILLFNVESLSEFEMINKISLKLKKKIKVALRINPDVDAKTHKYITTGKKENKFGIDIVTASKIFYSSVGAVALNRPKKYKYIDLVGIHLHIGSQITLVEPYVEAVKKTLAFIDEFKIDIQFFNIGGGFGIEYSDKDKPKTPDQFANKILPLLGVRKYKIIMEPGRYVAGNSGVLITKVNYIKENLSKKKFAICDAAMNDLIRPSLYNAYHQILPVVKRNGKKQCYDVVGPICETGDFFGKDRKLTEVKQNDLLAVKSAGAYGFAMSGNYNSRPRCAEIMIVKGKAQVIRKRETLEDLVRGE